MGRKFSAIKELEHFATDLSNTDGNMDLSNGLNSSVEEIISSFQEYRKGISDMASQTLVAINHYLHKGYTEQEILEEFNKHFSEGNKYKNIKELIRHYQTIGI